MATDRDHVLREAASLLLRRPTSSMDEIAKAAGISRATLHRLFPGRDALVGAMAEQAMRLVNQAINEAELHEGAAPEALRRLVGLLIPNADFLGFLYGESSLWEAQEVDDAWAEADRHITSVVRRGQEEGSMRVDLSGQWISEALFALIAAAGWASQEGRLARRDAGHSVIELLLGGAQRMPAT
jgi:AcrR family transcriptional regulator